MLSAFKALYISKLLEVLRKNSDDNARVNAALALVHLIRFHDDMQRVCACLTVLSYSLAQDQLGARLEPSQMLCRGRFEVLVIRVQELCCCEKSGAEIRMCVGCSSTGHLPLGTMCEDEYARGCSAQH